MNPAIQPDRWLFRFINGVLTNALFDITIPVLTDLHKSVVAIAVVSTALIFWLGISKRRGVHF